MWNGLEKIIRKVRHLRRTKILCDSKRGTKCIRVKARTSDTSILGEEAYIITLKEFREIEKYISSMNALKNFFQVIMNSSKGSRMFNIVAETWNPVTGCYHNCIYCWARRLALTKLKTAKRYRDGFKPSLNLEEFSKTFKGGVVFVSDMGDLFGDFIPSEWIRKVINYVKKFPDTYFLFLTKNPERYHEFIYEFPKNSILGTTIETNRDDLYTEYHISGAPLPSRRYMAMRNLNWPLKFVSIEPILDFDLDEFVQWIRDINPFMVYVGYDNYNWKLPEPPLRKTKELISALSEFTLVIKKTIRPAWNELIQNTKNNIKIKRILNKNKYNYTGRNI